MKRCRVLFSVSVGIFATSVIAQEVSPNAATEPTFREQVLNTKFSFTSRNVERIERFARCVVAHDRDGAIEFLSLPFASDKQGEFGAYSLMGGKIYQCLPAGRMDIPNGILQAFVVRASKEDDRSEISTLKRSPVNSIEQFADCVLDNGAPDVWTALAVVPKTDEDLKKVAALQAAVPPICSHFIDDEAVSAGSFFTILTAYGPIHGFGDA